MRRIVTVVAVVLVAALNIISIGQVLWSYGKYNAAYESRTVVLLNEQILSTLKDAETGERGYVISAKPEFLLPYNQTKEQIGLLFEKLAKLEAVEPDRFKRLKESCENFLTILDQNIKLVEGGKKTQAIEDIGKGNDKQAMDYIRLLVKDTQAKLYEEHLKDKQAADSSFGLVQWMLYINGILAAVIIMMALALHD